MSHSIEVVPSVRAQDREKNKVRYSIVIPTRNRLDLLLDAIYTIRKQEYDDWELVVYDNFSDEAIGPHVAALKDGRIKCYRSSTFLPVTDSWNNAIDYATGDYVILFGDDDGLLPGFFNRMDDLIQRFEAPDVIYSALLQFFHPTVAPWERSGYVDELRNGFFFGEAKDAFILLPEDTKRAVAGSLKVRRNFTFNMQAFTFQRLFLESCRVDGKVFLPPFPDYYLANYALARSAKTVVDPQPYVVAGVSRASFGYTLFNNLEERGAALLKSNHDVDPLYTSTVKQHVLPGPDYNTSYILTMAHLDQVLGTSDFGHADYERYRRLQIFACLEAQHGRLTWMRGGLGAVLFQRLTWRERLWATYVSYALKAPGAAWAARLKEIRAEIGAYGFQPTPIRRYTGDFARLPELYDALDEKSASKKAPTKAPTKVKQSKKLAANGAEPGRAASDGERRDTTRRRDPGG